MSRKGAQTRPVPRRYRSESFVGEWPTGLAWRPGEVREIPEGFTIAGEPPPGLVAVPQEDAAEEG